jgi:CYTH domain-containing protein
MGKEVERKFLVVDDAWRKGAMSTFYRQGYLWTSNSFVLRIGVAGWIKQ